MLLEQPQNARVALDPVHGSDRRKNPRDPRLIVILLNSVDSAIELSQRHRAEAVPGFEVRAKRLDALPLPNQLPGFSEISPVSHEVLAQSAARPLNDPPPKLPQYRQ